jgi:antitoxin CptB
LKDVKKTMLDQAQLNRIRWSARRGLLENDIVLERYFTAHSASMTEDDVVGLSALLTLSDNDLLDLVMVRKELADISTGEIAPQVFPHSHRVLETLRAVQ